MNEFDESKALSKYKILCNEMVDSNIISSIPWKNATLSDKKKQTKRKVSKRKKKQTKNKKT